MSTMSSPDAKPPAEILIVEDSATQRAQLQHLLENHNYKVAAAINGKEALAAARRRRPALIISDIVMPELDGYGLCKALDADDSLRDVPVILLTTLADSSDILKALECGADNFVRKPYEGQYLLSRIRYMLMNQEMRKGQKMTTGVELTLDNQTYFITTERQQVLDMLISTYEQAVAINAELKEQEKDLERSNQTLAAMLGIAGEMNKVNTMREVAEGVLKQAQVFPGVRAGWIVMLEGGKFSTVATVNLPPALEAVGAMEGMCLCRRQLLAGELNAVTDIPECERLQKAGMDSRHVSIPIRVGDEVIGLMNLIGSERGLFLDTDARNLRALGSQLGIALSRARMHENLERLVEERTAKLTTEIADRKRAEAEVRALNADLERRVGERTLQLDAANRAKSDFLANMSHELRTPLNSIIGFSEMLKDGLLGKLKTKQQGFVTDIFDAGAHLLSLINDILDLSKVEAGMQKLEPKAVEVAALLKASHLIVREKALARSIRLDTQLDPALGIMLVDARKLKQIVYNLLSNAVKFASDGGTVTLRAWRCARTEVALVGSMPGRLIALPPGDDEEFLAIAVEDSGVGIAEAHLPRLFEPFTQVDNSATRRQGGTGLGLSLVRRLAELHGGTVGVASLPGQGSCFTVWLPYHAGTLVAPADQMEDEAMAPLTDKALPLALVIEDDDQMAGLIIAQLRNEGYEVIRAATAEEGLVRAVKSPPQLITLDIFLPEMDGWEFMRRLKTHPQIADTPVVVISISQDRSLGVALGARRVLNKPFSQDELAAALAGLVNVPSGDTACVLVVEDNVQVSDMLATALVAKGYRVMRAYNGAEAINAARSAIPDLVILDLMMPEVDGFGVVRALRVSEHTARIPVLVLTAQDLSDEEHGRLKGAVCAVMKKSQFRISELLSEVRRALPPQATNGQDR